MATAAARARKRDLGPDWREALAASFKRFALRSWGILLLGVSIAGALALATHNSTDPSFTTAAGGPPANWLGSVGAYASDALLLLFGLGSALLLPVVGLAALSFAARRPTNLGVTDGRLAACPASPNCVSTQATDESHRIEPIPLEDTPQSAIERLKSAVASMPRMTVVTETDNYLHIEATSRLFRFVDDVEFFIDQDARLIHFRSASRVGHSDLGANRARMERIQAALVPKQTGP